MIVIMIVAMAVIMVVVVVEVVVVMIVVVVVGTFIVMLVMAGHIGDLDWCMQGPERPRGWQEKINIYR